jgi:thioredoxin 1
VRGTKRMSGATTLKVFVGDGCGGSAAVRSNIEVAIADTGPILVEEINAWDEPATTVEHQVLVLPTVIVLRDGVEVERLVGVPSGRRLQAALEDVTVLAGDEEPALSSR